MSLPKYRLTLGLVLSLGLSHLALGAHPAIQEVSLVPALSAEQPLGGATDSAVLGLHEVWRLGLSHDPSYKAAQSRYAASQAQKNISRAGLLPQVQASFQKSRVKGWRERPGAFGAIQRSDLDYDSTNYYAQLNQPLINYARYAEYRRGVALAGHGAAVFGVNEQRTGLRIASTYFDTILAYEDWRMQRNRVSFLEERVSNFEMLRQYEDTTEVELVETQARLALAKAALMQAADELRTHTRQLQAHIGERPQRLRGLSRQWHYQPLQEPLPELLLRARTQSREVVAAKEEVAVYQARYDAAVSQYFPTLDLVVSGGKADSEDLATLSQRSNTFAVGLRLNVPLFTGGYTTANKSQSRHQLQQAEHRLAATLDSVNTEVHKQYSLYTSGAQRVQAFQTAVSSAEISLDSALKSFSVGAASNLDVLDAQDELLEARYDYFKSRMELQLAQLQLYTALGQPLNEPVHRIAEAQFQGAILNLPGVLNKWGDLSRAWPAMTLAPVGLAHDSDDSLKPLLDSLLSAF